MVALDVTALDVTALQRDELRAPIELRFGPPLLTVRQARNWRYFALAVATMIMLAGWLADPYNFASSYGLISVVGYLLAGAVLNLLTVLPTIHRVTLS